MRLGMIDLHVHSRFSDGSFTIPELLQLAQEKGMSGIAITDHDDLHSIPIVQKLTQNMDIDAIPGVEVSTVYNQIDIHMLGYFIDPKKGILQEKLDFLIDSRYQRNLEMIKRLNDLGYEISYEMLPQNDFARNLGRPHIAEALLKAGYFNTFDEVFKKLLSRGKAGYVDKEGITPIEGIEAIRSSGGIPVLAHPFYCYRDRRLLEEFVAYLVDHGLGGIETYYVHHTRSETEFIKEIAQKYHLVTTGGSDFHGRYKPAIDLGTGRGSLYIDHSILDQLKVAHEQYL